MNCLRVSDVQSFHEDVFTGNIGKKTYQFTTVCKDNVMFVDLAYAPSKVTQMILAVFED